MSAVASALTEDDDDGSELTELRLAYEALFPVPESVAMSGSARGDASDGSVTSSDIKEICIQQDEETFRPRASSTTSASGASTARKQNLSSLDIVQEEIDTRRYFSSSAFEEGGDDGEQADGGREGEGADYRRNDVDYRLESIRPSSFDELEDLPTAARSDPYKKRPGGLLVKEDDSVSYSDIDADSGVPPPSIRMCMTVRNAAIEREFATEQLADIEYGETKRHRGQQTLQDLLEGGDFDDSPASRFDGGRDQFSEDKSSSKKSSKTSKFTPSYLTENVRKNVRKHSSKLDVQATKNLRRKNKRLWKFCVWNCRKITMILLLGLSLLAGIGLLTWWGVSKVTSANMAEADSDNADDIIDSAPTTSVVVPLEGGPTQVPSTFPSLRGNLAVSPANFTSTSSVPIIINNNTENSASPSPHNNSFYTVGSEQQASTASFIPSESPSPTIISSKHNDTNSSPQSLHPSVNAASSSSSLLDSSSPSSLSPISSPSPSSNLIYYIPSYPSSSPSSNASHLVRPVVYAHVQTITGMKEFEHAGSSVSMSPDGDFVAVGFKEADGPAVERTGLVRVYQRNTDNSYSSLGQDGMFGRATGDEFGASVSISNDGTRVAVGARSSSSSGKEKNGEVMVFEYSDASDSWRPLGSSIQGKEDAERLGFSVSMSGDGDRLAVGAPKGNGGTGSTGLHEYDGLDWILLGDVVVGESDGDRAGFSVSLSNDGTTLAVGAFTSSNGDLSSSGSVTVHKVEGGCVGNSISSCLVNQGQTLVGARDEAQFGYSVSLSGNGKRLVVGSNGFSSADVSKVGLCAVYELQEDDWMIIGNSIGSKENEEAGSHVSISKNGNVVSCSKSISIDGTLSGSLVVLEENSTGWNVADIVVASLGNSTSFGSSVSLSQDGEWIVAGGPSYNSSAGFFEIFTRLE